MNEIELKFTNINVEEIKEKLAKLGAVKIYESPVRSIQFSHEPCSREKKNTMNLRLREINNECFLTLKEKNKGEVFDLADGHVKSRKETQLFVEDFDKMCYILEKTGLYKTPIFKKHRIHYEFDDVHFELDTDPGIPTYLEIETQSIARMKGICKLLGLNYGDGSGKSIVDLYPEECKKHWEL